MDADRYTHGHHESVLRSHTWRTVENSAAHLVPHLRSGTSVLDVGCGPGTITADLAARVAPGRVVGVDRSAEVIERAAADHATADVEFRTADLMDLPFDDDTFDVVHAHQVLQHVADPVGALAEMRRVCRTGGVVAVRDADYASFSWAPGDARLDRWLEAYRAVARRNGGEPDAGRHLLGWLHAAGFERVDPGASVWCFATPEERDWWGGLWADRMTGSAIAGQLVDAGAASSDELDAMAAAFRQWAAHPDGWFCVPHGEAIAHA
ncbi:MAG: methyltransferase domain-containing protein [Microthrixaceae bacterium]